MYVAAIADVIMLVKRDTCGERATIISVSYGARAGNVDRNTSSATSMNMVQDMQAVTFSLNCNSLSSRRLRIYTMHVLQGIFTPVIFDVIRRYKARGRAYLSNVN